MQNPLQNTVNQNHYFVYGAMDSVHEINSFKMCQFIEQLIEKNFYSTIWLDFLAECYTDPFPPLWITCIKVSYFLYIKKI